MFTDADLFSFVSWFDLYSFYVHIYNFESSEWNKTWAFLTRFKPYPIDSISASIQYENFGTLEEDLGLCLLCSTASLF